jgi:Tol biopolymer transport system component
VVATVPAPPGAVREEQFDPVFSPDGRSVAYTSNVAVVDDADAPTISTVRVARLGDGTAGRVVTRLGRDAVWDLDWSTAGTISVTRPAGSRSYTTTLLGSDGRVLGEEPTPRGQDVIPTGPVGTTLLLPLRDLSVRRPSDVDIARCAL